ncbi:MAG: hypothetical protein WB711_19060 [Terriglobales bacterium]
MTSRSLTPNFGTVKDLGLKTGAIVMLAAASVFGAGADKHSQTDYSLALEVSETQSQERAHDVSIAKASDGNMYVISCADRSGASRFRAAVKTLEGEKDAAAAATVPDCGGLTLVPGVVYRARWQKGNLKILVQEPGQDAGSKAKEATFTVIRAQKMTVKDAGDCKACILVKEQ